MNQREESRLEENCEAQIVCEDAELREKQATITDFLDDARGNRDEQGDEILERSMGLERPRTDKGLYMAKSQVYAKRDKKYSQCILTIVPVQPLTGALLAKKICKRQLASANTSPSDIETQPLEKQDEYTDEDQMIEFLRCMRRMAQDGQKEDQMIEKEENSYPSPAGLL